MRMLVAMFLTVLMFAGVSGGIDHAAAAGFSVDSTADAVDADPGDGVCASDGGECTLRAAIQEANATPEADIITLPAGIYTLTIARVGDGIASGDLNVTASLTISGAGADATIIDGNQIDRVFNIFGADPEFTLTDLTVQGGVPTKPTSKTGGGISVRNGSLTLDRVIVQDNEARSDGGGIYSFGPVVIRVSAIQGNVASGTGGGINANVDLTLTDTIVQNNTSNSGGGARSGGVFTIERSAIINNVAEDSGGGISVSSNGVLHATNVTVSGNRTNRDDNGAGVNVSGTGSTLHHVTIAHNIGSWGLRGFSADATITDSIIAGNAHGDCRGGGLALTPLGTNLDSDGSCGFGITGEAGLARLAYTGGPAGVVHALTDVSLAIDAAAGCVAVDQRGVDRPLGLACDLGAFESHPTPSRSVEAGTGFSTLGWTGGATAPSDAFGTISDSIEGI